MERLPEGKSLYTGVILAPFEWLARRGSWLIAAGLFVGVAIPDLARLLKPVIGPAVFVLLVATVLRIDWSKAAVYTRQLPLLAVVLAWLLFAAPSIMWVALRLIDLPEGLARALVLTASSPVLTAVPTFALMLGLDATLALIAMIATSALQPFLQPPLALLLLGIDLDIGVAQLMARLGLFIAGGFAVALALRLLFGRKRLTHASQTISGISVLMLIVFGIGAMDGLTHTVLQRPASALIFLLAAFVGNFALQLIGGVVFVGLSRLGIMSREQALTAALASGNRNLAILVAVLGSSTDPDLFLFFAVNQFPMYFVPSLLGPVYRHLLDRPPTA